MINLLPIVTSVLEFIKTAGGLIKPKGELKEIVRNPQFQQKFLNQNGNNYIINVNGDLYLGDYSKISNSLKKDMLASLKNPEFEKPKHLINFYDSEFYQRIIKFTSTKISDENIEKYYPYLKHETRNLFETSIYIKRMFEQGNFNEANSSRSDLGNQYGKEGRKFCNLYIQGYIHAIINFIETQYNIKKIPDHLDSEIMYFVNHSESIFFIHSKTDKKSIIMKIEIAINRNEEYIALHAGNKLNIEKTKIIVNKIRNKAEVNRYNIKYEKEHQIKNKTSLLNVYITLNQDYQN